MNLLTKHEFEYIREFVDVLFNQKLNPWTLRNSKPRANVIIRHGRPKTDFLITPSEMIDPIKSEGEKAYWILEKRCGNVRHLQNTRG